MSRYNHLSNNPISSGTGPSTLNGFALSQPRGPQFWETWQGLPDNYGERTEALSQSYPTPDSFQEPGQPFQQNDLSMRMPDLSQPMNQMQGMGMGRTNLMQHNYGNQYGSRYGSPLQFQTPPMFPLFGQNSGVFGYGAQQWA